MNTEIRRPLIAAGALAILVSAGVLVAGQDGRDHPQAGAQLGDVAPSFVVTTIAGGEFRFPTGKPTAMLFTAASCSSCLEAAKSLGRVKRDRGDGLDAISVDIDPAGTPAGFRDWIATAGSPPLTFARDKASRLATAYQVTGLSTVLVTDGDGRVLYRSLAPDEGAVQRAVTRAGR